MAESYSQDDIQQILHLAFARQTDEQDILTRSQLFEIGEELGLEAHEIQSAEADWQVQKGQLLSRQAFDRDRHQRFQQRLIKFVIINGFLVALDLMIGGGLTWSRYVLVLCSLMLALLARKTYWLSGEAYQRQFEGWQRKRKLKRSLDGVVNRFLPS